MNTRLPTGRALHRVGRAFAIAAVLVAAAAGAARAQDPLPIDLIIPWDSLLRPYPSSKVVLVHGGNAGRATWDEFTFKLNTAGYAVHSLDLPQSDPIQHQADLGRIAMGQSGFNTPTTMFAAHSQGGIVSRVISHDQAMRALVTIGSPHLGMQAADNHHRLTETAAWISVDMFLIALLQLPPSTGPDYYYQPYLVYRDPILTRFSLLYGLIAGGTVLSALNVYQTQIWGGLASWDEVSPNSIYLANLNANVATERVEHAYSIMADAGTGYIGGPIRLLTDGPSAQVMGERLWFFGEILNEAAYTLLDQALYSETWNYDILAAYGLIDLAWRVQNLGDWWTWDIVGDFPHDGLIPTEQQFRPQSERVGIINIAHTQETNTEPAMNRIKEFLDLHRP
jgi:hypothetical protein